MLIYEEGDILQKKFVWLFVFFVVLFVLLVIGAVVLLRLYRVDTELFDSGIVVAQCNATTQTEALTEDDLAAICKMFDGKMLYKDNPSCGFDGKNAIVLCGDEVFCVACDGCPILFYENKDRYFRLSDEENDRLHRILAQYGLNFPCV